MNKLPKSVQRQVAQADATLAAAQAPANEPVPVAPAPAEQPAAPAPAPAAEAPAPAPTASPAPPPAGDSEQTWEQRYRSLQGIHNHHVADLKQRLRQTEEVAAAARAELERARRAEPTPPEPAPVDPKDAETFGADLVQMVMRVAEIRITAMAARLEARVAELEQRLQGTSQAVALTAEEMFLSRLKEAVPDWKEINTSPGFLAWLAEIDRLSGTPRQAALDSAANAMDAVRVSNIFNAYKETVTPVAPPAAAPAPASSLERQVAPSTGASAPQLRTEQPRTMSSAFVQQFYREVANGRYRGRDAEAARIEAQINQALAEGRIV